MYGLVHAAARSMVQESLGELAWANVLQDSGLGQEHFISGQNYPDDVTFAIVASIANVTGTPAEELLVSFGEYWIAYAAKSSYGPMFQIAGTSLDSFLQNLNRMHASVQNTMQASRMPSFEVLRCDSSQIDIVYDSEREGLEPFVTGLLKGLLTHFGERGDISQAPKKNGRVFTIRRIAARSAA